MSKRLLIASGVIVIGAAVAGFIGQRDEVAKTDRLIETLIQSESRPVIKTIKSEKVCASPYMVKLAGTTPIR